MRIYSFARVLLSRSLLGVLVVVAGCGEDDEIKTYRVAKPESTPPQMPDPAAESGTPQIVGHTPDGWEEQPPSSMRQASFVVRETGGEEADVSLVILGGEAGGPLENVNRWRGQLGQPAIDEAQLRQMAERIPTSLGSDGMFVDIDGTPESGDAKKDGRILAAMVPAGGRVWFFKMRGNHDLVEKQKSAFKHWVGTVQSPGLENSGGGPGGSGQ